MARRERTTALPRHRPRDRAARGRRFAGITWDDRTVRLAIIGGAAALGLFVIGIFLWGWYHDRFVKPNEVVLEVGDTDVKLNYYTDRLASFIQQNQSSGLSLSLLEQSLLTKLEDEELTLQLARDRGITITEDDVTTAIADSLGTTPGGDGSVYDNLYRQRLKAVGMSNDNYRRLMRAQAADQRIKEQIAAEIGDTGELITLRTVVLDSEDKAKEIRDRIAGGEDMGTLAQTESLDLTSRQADGVMQPEPAALLPESVRNSVDGQSEGYVSDPVQVQNNWWVLRVEKRDPGGTYSDAQKQQLANQQFDDLLQKKRAETEIKRSLDAGDIDWAESHAG